MISDETVAQVRAYPDIVTIISDYVTLKKRGRNFIGLCPFHQERTPSFTVSPDKGLWHCFGCHVSGDHIGFVMQIDHLSFSEAIVHIANRVGIAVVETKSDSQTVRDDQKRKLFDSLYAYRTECESHFPGSVAQAYLLSRGFTQDSFVKFHVGYALPHSSVPRFRNRVIFPIIDVRGRTVGFGARQLAGDTAGPKYINSDDSLVFNKRYLLYGVDQAKSAIQKEKAAILVEGYLDVMAAHQFGFRNVVGTMGTALTHEHGQLLKRFCSKVILVFDSDTAGRSAVDRSYEVLRPLDFQIFVANLTSKDPADLLMGEGEAAFRQALDAAVPILAYTINQVHRKWSGRIEEVPELLDTVFQILRQEPDAMVQRYYAKQISTLFKLESEWVLAKLKRVGYNTSQVFFPKQITKSKFQKAQDYLIYAMAVDLSLRQFLQTELVVSDFQISPLHQALFEYICASDLVGRDLLVQVQDQEFGALLGRLLLESDWVDEGCLGYQDYLLTVKGERTQNRISDLKRRIAEAEQLDDEDLVSSLMEQLRDLLKTDQ